MERKNIYDKCVYTTPNGLCSGTAALHPKEHYLPAGLGNFEGDVRLHKYICDDCQNRFSRYEEVFLRNSPEAFIRNIVKVRGRRSHASKNIFLDPTSGLRPITVKGPLPGFAHNVLWKVGAEEQLHLMNQLIFKKHDGEHEWVPIRSGRIAGDLAALKHDNESWQLLFIFSDDATESELALIFGETLKKSIDLHTALHEGKRIAVEMRAVHSLPYIQALCKIAFHFVLAHFHFTGYEAEFDELKRFIYLGVGQGQASIVEEPLLAQLAREDAYLLCWCHILTAEYSPAEFIARMQFFVGPKLNPLTWRINLGANPSRVVTEEAKGFSYRYYKTADSSGYVGRIEKLGLGPKLLSNAVNVA